MKVLLRSFVKTIFLAEKRAAFTEKILSWLWPFLNIFLLSKQRNDDDEPALTVMFSALLTQVEAIFHRQRLGLRDQTHAEEKKNCQRYKILVFHTLTLDKNKNFTWSSQESRRRANKCEGIPQYLEIRVGSVSRWLWSPAISWMSLILCLYKRTTTVTMCQCKNLKT